MPTKSKKVEYRIISLSERSIPISASGLSTPRSTFINRDSGENQKKTLTGFCKVYSRFGDGARQGRSQHG